MRESKAPHLSLLLATLLAAGCGSTEPSRFYLLNPLPKGGAVEENGDFKLMVGPVSVADYINRPQLVLRESENEVHLQEFHRWAEPLKDRIAYVLVENLSQLLSTNQISLYPFEAAGDQGRQVTVWIAEFDAYPGKEVVLKAWWRLYDSEKKKLLKLGRSLIRKPLNEDHDYAACAAAWSEALADFSREIAEAIKKE
jgi:uncharacterized lipoprotein YmbA